MSAWVVILVVMVVIVLGAPIRARTKRNARHAQTGSPPPARRAIAAVTGRVTVTVDFCIDDASQPVVERLIDRVAAPYLADPTVRAVEVREVGGRVIGVRHPRPTARIPPASSDLLLALPADEGAMPARLEAGPGGVTVGPPTAAPPASVLARLDLPAEVTARLGDEPSVGELVEALLGASGTAFNRRGGALVVGDVAVVALDAAGWVTEAQLNQAYLKFATTEASHGVALTNGQLPHRELGRRHALAPHLRHGSVDALQRLADEVALEGDIAATLRELAAGRPHGTHPMSPTADLHDLVSNVTIFTDEHGAVALLALRDVPAGSCRCSRPASAISAMTNPSRSPQ